MKFFPQRQIGVPIDTVLWDYDGTLVGTRYADEAAVRRLIAQEPGAAAGAAVFWEAEGMPLLARIETAWPGRSEEFGPLFMAKAAPQRFDGIQEVLEQLAESGYRMGVVSSRRRLPLLEGLAESGLLPHFGVIVSLDDVAQPKPSPEGLLQALALLGAAPSQTAYVGDSDVDMEAGRTARIATWRAGWSAPASIAPRGKYVLTHPLELLSCLSPASEEAS